jgi:hypothetical protein
MNFRDKFPVVVAVAVAVAVCIVSCNTGLDNQSAVSPDAIVNPNGRNDAWDFIGPGGGGAMPFIPAINPSDPDNIFVSCDMTGSFVTYDGGEKWRMFNLRGVTKFYAFERMTKCCCAGPQIFI